MLYLPPELLEHILHYLDRPALCRIAQTCTVFKRLARPIIFDNINVELVLAGGTLDLQQLTADLQALSCGQQPAGGLVRDLAIDFADSGPAENASSPHPVQSGLVSGMTALIELVPHIHTLRLRQLPGQQSPQTALGSSTELVNFQRSLGQLESLLVLQFKAESDKDCSWWLELVIPALPLSLREMYMAADFVEGSDLTDTFASVPSNHRNALAVLYFMCPQMGPASDKLFNFLLSSSPHLETVLVSHQFCSKANIQDLFARDRTHRVLNLEAYAFPGVPECQLELQQQMHLQYVHVQCGNAFLYYLAYLPRSVRGLRMDLWVSREESPDIPRVVPLDICWTLVYQCLEDACWCPELSRLNFRLFTMKNDDDEFEQQSQICEEQMEALVGLLVRRKVVPAIGQDYWVLTRAEDNSV